MWLKSSVLGSFIREHWLVEPLRVTPQAFHTMARTCPPASGSMPPIVVMTVTDNHDSGNNNLYIEHFYVPGTVRGTLTFTVT